jgi:hypothetical protein
MTECSVCHETVTPGVDHVCGGVPVPPPFTGAPPPPGMPGASKSWKDKQAEARANAPPAPPSLKDLYRPEKTGSKFNRVSRGVRRTLIEAPNAASELIIDCLVTAVAEVYDKPDPGTKADMELRLTGMTLDAFKRLSPQQQYAFINVIWGLSYTEVLPATLAQNMVAPADSVRSFPTGVRPDGSVPARGMGVADPWTRFAIGFRVDGSADKPMTRVLTQGMRPKWFNPADARMLSDSEITGTWMDLNKNIKMGRVNRDVLNETGTCVARNIYGGTAFPERTSEGEYYLFAVRCKNLLGVDTEQWQLDHHTVWRAGEKVFPEIPKERILAWVKFKKLGTPQNFVDTPIFVNGVQCGCIRKVVGLGGWKFQIPAGSKWTWLAMIAEDEQAYLEGELAAWAGPVHTIADAWDFMDW